MDVCAYSTRAKCTLAQPNFMCHMVHYKIKEFAQTEPSLGDCSYLNTCHHLDSCRYLHYELETPSKERTQEMARKREENKKFARSREKLLPPQWLDCDLRKLDATVLGTFDVIMADPPWDSECIASQPLTIAHEDLSRPNSTVSDIKICCKLV